MVNNCLGMSVGGPRSSTFVTPFMDMCLPKTVRDEHLSGTITFPGQLQLFTEMVLL
jgi:hypothetical protein